MPAQAVLPELVACLIARPWRYSGFSVRLVDAVRKRRHSSRSVEGCSAMTDLDMLSVKPIRGLCVDTVQKAESGHPEL
ncbi:hypothetical protein GCM10022206_23540 [Streptomyces chiangmaiensis]